MHNITIIGSSGHQCLMNIDGIEIKLSKRNNKIDITDSEKVSAVIDEIAYLLGNNKPLYDLPKKLCAVNIIRIMDAFFYEVVLNYWSTEFESHFNGRRSEFLKIFFGCFGFTHAFYNKTRLMVRIRQFTCEYVRYLEVVRSENFEVEYLSQNNNTFTFRINNKQAALCLAGRVKMRNPANVLKALTTLKEGLDLGESLIIKDAINQLGSVASLNLMDLFFKDDAKKYFCDITIESLHKTRELLHPTKLLKEYFGCSKSSFYTELLEALERLIPEHNAYLVNSSIDVLSTNDGFWILYDFYANQIHRLNLIFSGSPQLIAETQSFLRYRAKRYIISGKPFSQYLYRVWSQLSIAINLIYDEQDNLLESILDLTVFDYQDLQAYLAQETDYAFYSQKDICTYLRALYNFTLSQNKHLALEPLKAFKFPKNTAGSGQHVEPISQVALNALLTNLDELPAYIRLAFLLCAITGARANSICLLTTGSLQKSGEECAVKIYYQKTAEDRIRQGKSPYVTHEIPEKLFNDLKDYIRQTENLRAQVETPYIFVYRSVNHRVGTMRLPNVLKYGVFQVETQKILDKVQLYNDRGDRVTCCFRNIRAEVGRAMFAAGKTEKEVAAKLGNSQVVSRTHYNVAYPTDEAELYNRQYNITVETVKGKIELKASNSLRRLHQKELYGHCTAGNDCSNKNDCHNCPQRITIENHEEKE